MLLDSTVLLGLLFLGGIAAIDGTTFGQFMVSRPLVSATLGGWMVGAPAQGALIGMVLEIFQLTVLPVGAARYPEGGPAAVAAGAVFASGPAGAGALLVMLVATLGLEWAGGESVRYLRQANSSLLRTSPPRSALALEQRHLAAIIVDFVRGVLLVSIGLLLLMGVQRFLLPYWGLGEELTRLILAAALAGSLVSAVRLVGWFARFAAVGAIAAAGLLLFA